MLAAAGPRSRGSIPMSALTGGRRHHAIAAEHGKGGGDRGARLTSLEGQCGRRPVAACSYPDTLTLMIQDGQVNRHLPALAAYNAGPERVQALQAGAADKAGSRTSGSAMWSSWWPTTWAGPINYCWHHLQILRPTVSACPVGGQVRGHRGSAA